MRIQPIHIGLLTALLMAFAPARASMEVEAMISADKAELEIGDPVEVTVTVKYDRHCDLLWPGFVERLGEMEIIDASDLDSNIQMEHIELRQTYRVSAYDSGSFRISPLAFPFRNAYGAEDTAMSNELQFNVFTVAVDTAQAIKPIKANREAPISLAELLPWILWALLIVLISLHILLALDGNRKRKQPKVVKVEPQIPAHEWALQQIRELEAEELWQNNQSKEYYFRLSEIVRDYLERRYDFPALESTTPEVLSDVDKHLTDADLQSQLKELLELSDLVKFAKWKTVADENLKAADLAREFVCATRKPEGEAMKKTA